MRLTLVAYLDSYPNPVTCDTLLHREAANTRLPCISSNSQPRYISSQPAPASQQASHRSTYPPPPPSASKARGDTVLLPPTGGLRPLLPIATKSGQASRWQSIISTTRPRVRLSSRQRSIFWKCQYLSLAYSIGPEKGALTK